MELSFDLAFSKDNAPSNINNTLPVKNSTKNNNKTNTKHRKRKRKKKKSATPSQIVVSNYSSALDTLLLVNYFEDYCGDIKSYEFGFTIGIVNFGFITFTDRKSVEKSAALNDTTVNGEKICVTVQNQNKTKTSNTEVSKKLVLKNLPLKFTQEDNYNKRRNLLPPPGMVDDPTVATSNHHLSTETRQLNHLIVEKTNMVPVDIEIYRDSKNRPRGVAFVTFKNVQNAVEAHMLLNANNGFYINNREITVQYFQPGRMNGHRNNDATSKNNNNKEQNLNNSNKTKTKIIHELKSEVKRDGENDSLHNTKITRSIYDQSLTNDSPVSTTSNSMSYSNIVSPKSDYSIMIPAGLPKHSNTNSLSSLASEFDDKASIISLGSSIENEHSMRSRIMSFDGQESNASSLENGSPPLLFQSILNSANFSATDFDISFSHSNSSERITTMSNNAIPFNNITHNNNNNIWRRNSRNNDNKNANIFFMHSTKNTSNNSVLKFARGPDGTKGFKLKRSTR
jgi:hypothetical protein